MTSKHFLKIQGPLLSILALFIGAGYVYFWQHGYSSDFAMIGLIGKRILETGQQFIFAPKVGYQGLLLEGNLVALMFKWFGITPQTLNLAPYLVYLAFCFVFYRAVRAWHGTAVAGLATLFTILSTPFFYSQVLRTQPNYGETYLMGSALFWIYHRLWSTRKPHLLLCFLFGLIAGFGFYTYGQIIYFIGAIGFHLLLFATFQDFKGWSRTIRKLLKFFVGYFAFSFFCFLISFEKVQFAGRIWIKFSPLGMMMSSVAILGLIILATSVFRHWKALKAWIPGSLVAAVGAVLGVSPLLYFKMVLHGKSLNRIGNGGNLDEILERLGFLLNGKETLFNFTDSWVTCFGFLAGMALISVYLYSAFGSLSRKKLESLLSPYFTLIWVVLAAFLTANAVTSAASIRYALALTLPISVAYSIVILQNRKPWVALAATLILLTNITAIGQSYFLASKGTDFQPLIQYLEKKKIYRGFGNYWCSYAMNFLTHESVMIEPTDSNYLPFYMDPVQAENKIVYVDFKPYQIEVPEIVEGQVIQLYQKSYRVFEKATLGDLNEHCKNAEVFVVEKAQ